MVPSARFDKPGKSPFMDMQLVPVYADEAGRRARSHVSPDVSQNLGIRLGTVEKAVLQSKLPAVGSVAFDERLLELVQARVEGYVTRLHVKTPLERVQSGSAAGGHRGAGLARGAGRIPGAARCAVRTRASDPRRCAPTTHRARRARKHDPRAGNATQDRRDSDDSTAPIDGVVTELAVRDGAAFMPGAALFRINGLETVWVNAQIPEAQVSMIPVGSNVDGACNRLAGRRVRGPRGRAPARSRSADAHAAGAHRRSTIPTQARARHVRVARVRRASTEQAQLVVPSEAVIMTGERNVVIVAREGGGFDVAEVTVGAEAEGKTAVLSGLEEGQAIVLSGQFLIDSEASLKSAVSTPVDDASRSHDCAR